MDYEPVTNRKAGVAPEPYCFEGIPTYSETTDQHMICVWLLRAGRDIIVVDFAIDERGYNDDVNDRTQIVKSLRRQFGEDFSFAIFIDNPEPK